MEPTSRDDEPYPQRRSVSDRPRDDRAAYDDRVRGDAVPDDRVRDDGVRDRPVTTDDRLHDDRVHDDSLARDKFGGANLGAGFFGWLVAVGMAALLTGILAVIATAVGYTNDITPSDAERAAGTVSLVTGIVLLVVLLIAYYSGGYVAGRMSRFDGGRQGLVVWIIGLLVTVVAAVLGYVRHQYNLLDRVDVPLIPIPTDQKTWAGIITGVAVVLGTLLAAMAGGRVGRRYHYRVDRARL